MRRASFAARRWILRLQERRITPGLLLGGGYGRTAEFGLAGPSTIRYGSDVSPFIWTVGHSTRTSHELRSVLMVHNIEVVVDVRRFPGSRRLPQFSTDVLERDLARAAILYRWIPELGGRRRPSPGSTNDAWRHPGFRGYADHIATEEFAVGLNDLLMLASGLRTVIMCAEALWWHCHRRLIADVLTAIGVPVVHLRDQSAGALHELAPPARLTRGRLTYAPIRRASG